MDFLNTIFSGNWEGAQKMIWPSRRAIGLHATDTNALKIQDRTNIMHDLICNIILLQAVENSCECIFLKSFLR